MGIQKVTEIKIHSIADIVFCIDCSFSMIPIINSIKNDILLLIKALDEYNEYLKIDWRARIVAFRDSISYDRPFTTKLDEFKSQLDEIKAKGCVEDEPAPIIETIRCATKCSEWRRACHKKILLFTDTTAKPIDDLDFKVIVEELTQSHIQLFLWGKKSPLYEKLMIIPRSDIIQIEDPIEFYYHKSIDFGNFMDVFERKT